jgi:hypothetical protein
MPTVAMFFAVWIEYFVSFLLEDTMNLNQLNFRSISVEVQHSNSTLIQKLLLDNGYRVLQIVEDVDIIFVK